MFVGRLEEGFYPCVCVANRIKLSRVVVVSTTGQQYVWYVCLVCNEETLIFYFNRSDGEG